MQGAVEVEIPEALIEHVGLFAAGLGDGEGELGVVLREHQVELEEHAGGVEVLDAADVGIAGVEIAAERLIDDGAGLLGARAERDVVVAASAGREVGIEEGEGGKFDAGAVERVVGSRAGEVGVGGADLDAAALRVEAAHGGVEGFAPDILVDAERFTDAHFRDVEAVLAGEFEAGEIEQVYISAGGRIGGLGDGDLALEDGFAGRFFDDDETLGDVGKFAAGAHPEGDSAGLDRVIRSVAELVEMDGVVLLAQG